MSKRQEISLTSLDELFTTEADRQEEKLERVQELPTAELKPFRDHPFKVLQDEEMDKLCQSMREYGVLSPLMARPNKEGGYELISGHRRKFAAELLGLEKVPVLVREMSDEESVIVLVDSNIQRENLLPSEKAFAYKMKLEALNHQGVAFGQLGQNYSRDRLADESQDSSRQIHRYIRLTELVPPLLELVDQKRIAFSPGVELSYLTKEEQAELWDIIQAEDRTPSHAQAIRLKKLSQNMELTPEMMGTIMAEEKPNQREQVKLPTEKLRKYFPKSFTPEQMMDAIFKLLEENQRKKQRNREAR